MNNSSTESFHSTRSRQSSISGSPPPPKSRFYMNTTVGVPLATTITTHNVGQLNNRCQTLGLSPRYVIYGDQPIGFGGYLQFGHHTISRDERWPSKKAAREGLAQKGLAILNGRQSERAEDVSSVENWVGMLYCKLGPPAISATPYPFCSTYAHRLNAYTGGGFFLALSSLPSNLPSNRRKCGPYLHRIHRRFRLCMHLPHILPLDTIWFRITILY